MKINEFERNYMEDFLQAIEEADFFDNFKQSYTTVCIWVSRNCDLLEEYAVQYFCGATRGVFVFDDKWVLKFDIIKGYCTKELENYRKAIEAELDQYFAPIEFFEERCGVDFYLQEYCEDLEENYFFDALCESEPYRDDESDDEFYNRMVDYEYCLDDDDRIFFLLGKNSETRKLVAFCGENAISDLHEGNWGYQFDDFIIRDYAGYRG